MVSPTLHGDSLIRWNDFVRLREKGADYKITPTGPSTEFVSDYDKKGEVDPADIVDRMEHFAHAFLAAYGQNVGNPAQALNHVRVNLFGDDADTYRRFKEYIEARGGVSVTQAAGLLQEALRINGINTARSSNTASIAALAIDERNNVYARLGNATIAHKDGPVIHASDANIVDIAQGVPRLGKELERIINDREDMHYHSPHNN